MLERVLEQVREGGTLETGRLAAELGVSVELVQVLLEHLQRQGLIQGFVHCAESCRGCGLRDGCAGAHDDGLRLWRGVS